jgi:transcriptional regulator with PAS, ATPase and Fis domain
MRSALAPFASLVLAELKRRRAPSVGQNLSERSVSRSHIGFNNSLISKSKQQQLAWLADQITGDSPAIQKTRELMRLAIIKQADSVLLIGETGTGKGVCAFAIHEGIGDRGRFIEVNCAALPRDLIESELFGHEKGSFTGATSRKIGLFEQADGGTIFLDEIAELPPDLQVKLLTVLQRRELRRIGGSQAIPINVRVIAATNRPLKIALNDGTFRRDLFFRIGSLRIELPALRDRGDDVTLLARHFIAELVKAKGECIEGLALEAEVLLKQYDWPGNVRQLLNVIRRAIILESGNIVSAQTIYQILGEEKRLFNVSCPVDPNAPQRFYRDLKRILITQAEAHEIILALTRNRNNKSKTAKELGLTRGQLDYRLKLIEQMEK